MVWPGPGRRRRQRRAIRGDVISRLFQLKARQAFITAENIDELLVEAGVVGPLGLLSIDIDGVDYWVWQAITKAIPDIVVVEYNALFGPDRAISVPYRSDFDRGAAHPSRLYWGASLPACCHLAAQKGYDFIGCNGNGNNAYFIRKELRDHPSLANLRPEYVVNSFAEYAPDGEGLRDEPAAQLIRGLPVVNVLTGEVEPF